MSCQSVDANPSSTNDDFGSWDCKLCTYVNSAERFKCEICDFRRGPSTRKPRCNLDSVVAKIVKQQEQISQQTKSTKSTPKSRPNRSESAAHIRTPSPPSSSSSTTLSRTPSPYSVASTLLEAEEEAEGEQECEPEADADADGDADADAEESTHNIANNASASPLPSSQSLDDHHHHPLVPIEVDGNLIKYNPPTSTGRTGLIIDKKRFTQHSVTVNDVTITFTEFATRQNNYVRKKKKNRRDRNRPRGNSATARSRETTTTN